MFANALLAVTVIVLATATMLSAGLAVTRAGVHRIAQQYLSSGYARAISATHDAVADALRSGQLDALASAPLPEISPLPPACATSSAPCAFFTDATVTLSAPSDVQPANLESNTAVNEGRLSATITVDVTTADGTRLATRTRTVALRTFAVPPYVTIAGARDASIDDAGGVSAGDDGGLPSQTPLLTCPSTAPSSAPDETVVRVQYHDDANGACMDGSLWHGGPPRANKPAAPWSP